MYLFSYMETRECSKPDWYTVFCFHSQHIIFDDRDVSAWCTSCCLNSLMLKLWVIEVNGKSSILFGPTITGGTQSALTVPIRSLARAAPTCGNQSQIYRQHVAPMNQGKFDAKRIKKEAGVYVLTGCNTFILLSTPKAGKFNVDKCMNELPNCSDWSSPE